MSAPIERTVRLATTVNTLTEAWAFVMEHLDEMGDDPSIEIRPQWIVSSDSDENGREFSVVISGMIEEAPL